MLPSSFHEDTLAAFRGREVCCLTLGFYLDAARRRGIPLERLTEGTGIPLRLILNPRSRISWDTCSRILDNVQQLWSEAEIEALGQGAITSPWFRPFASIARLRYGPLDVYRWVSRPGNSVQRQLFTCVAYTLEEHGPHHAGIRADFAPGYEPHRVYLLAAKGAFAAAPTLFGYETAQVAMDPIPRGARYAIRLPVRAGLRSRLRLLLSWPFAARRAASLLEEAYEDLHESVRRYAAIFDASGDAIVINDLDGSVLEANPAAWRMFGYSRDEFVGVDPRLLVPAPARETYQRYLEAIGRGRSVQFEQALLRRDGTAFDAEIRGSPIEYRGRRCALGVVRDVTQRHRAEMEHARLEDQLRQAQKMEAVGQLAGGLAHDFNNLLTVITGYAELLLDLTGDHAEASDAVQQIRIAADRGASLTRQLLTFSRTSAVAPEVLLPNEVILELRKMLERLIGEDVELAVELDEGAGWLEADPGQLEQALVNLVLNARDAMPEGGRLTLSTHLWQLDAPDGDLAAGSWVRIGVEDTGQGMSEDVRQRIFEPFFTTKEVGRGTGLGLATVFGFVRQCGGAIRVRSAPGAGARFDLILPSARARRERAGAPELAGSLRARPGETLLLVEDEPMVRELARATLESAGFRVLQAANGVEALDRVREHPEPIDLVIADVVMPRLSGAALARRLRELDPRARVLLVSGYADGPSAGGPLPPDARFLAKPFRREDLLREVRRALDEG